jgi:hypothetical protein
MQATTSASELNSKADLKKIYQTPATTSASACSDQQSLSWSLGATSKRSGFIANPYSKGLGCGHQLSGFVQGQLQFNQISEDQLQASGAPLNRDQFVLRATRVRFDAGYSHAGYSFELDANTVRGPRVGIRRAEGLLFYRNAQPGSAPLVALSLGVSDIPFGYELVESNSTRWFIERSVASEALFPTQTDINARVFGAWRFLRYALALGNGQPVNDSSYASDPNAPKELVARFGADAAFSDSLAVSGGTSFSFGKGFHPGSPAVKDGVAWRDDNSDGIATPNEIVGVPGSAATASANFERWVLGVDLQLQLRSSIGLGVLALEGYLGSNHDRGLFTNDPAETGRDLRQSGLVLSLTQQVLEYGIVGFRVSNYDPDSDFAEGRRGDFVPRSQGVTALSPLLGVAWPDQARLILQYDWVRDQFARDSVGVPMDAKNNQLTARLQVAL